MFTMYSHVSKHHSSDIYMKENSNTDCDVNVKNFDIRNDLGQNVSGLQIFLNFAQNSESESHTQRSRK